MPTHPETTSAKLKSAIIATVCWLYACSEWQTPEPFATAAECHRALAELQYYEGHHGEYRAELERGGWCAMAYDSSSGTDRCSLP